ncbi:MAG: aromatic ring-hydroxylating dioxygenase subunit alpha, partial [Gammaproteobacteria bacterium]|nr:aromatic ring-hydroxylating dioxygenase subunit alpha [Gammaproteobacteria bacterium]
TAEAWCYVLSQDFSNMAAVQQGMKSAGFSGPKPNPYMERATANLHRNLAEYMGTGSPGKLQENN